MNTNTSTKLNLNCGLVLNLSSNDLEKLFLLLEGMPDVKIIFIKKSYGRLKILDDLVNNDDG